MPEDAACPGCVRLYSIWGGVRRRPRQQTLVNTMACIIADAHTTALVLPVSLTREKLHLGLETKKCPRRSETMAALSPAPLRM